MQQRGEFSVSVTKDYLVFASAHFITFAGHRCEGLHGHNYHVVCEVDGSLSQFGLVIDFKMVKPIIKELCDHLDEHWLVPGEHREPDIC